jgi:type IV secretory pathway TrbL component
LAIFNAKRNSIAGLIALSVGNRKMHPDDFVWRILASSRITLAGSPARTAVRAAIACGSAGLAAFLTKRSPARSGTGRQAHKDLG